MVIGAQHPPADLPGLDPRDSRLVQVADAVTGRTVTWHVLDNAPRLRECGAEPVGTILCVHGNPTWSYLWRGLVDRATSSAEGGLPAWRVVAPDQLEMGFSERTGATRRLADRVADLGALTAELGLEGPIVVLGHDWGGVVASGWAIDHTETLAGVMLLNTAVHQPDSRSVPAALRLVRHAAVRWPSTVATPAFLEATLRLAHPRLDAEVADGYRAPYRHPARRKGIGQFVADIPVDERSVSDRELERIATGLRGIRVPSLLLWGPEDPIFGDCYLDDLIERMPASDVHRFERAGHLLAEDVDYAGAVLQWLSDRRIAGAAHQRLLAQDAAAAPATGENPDAATTSGRLWSALDARAESDAVALVEMAPARGRHPRRVSWSLLARRVDEIAAGLGRLGVVSGDRVSLLVPPGADLTAAAYACLRIGAVIVVADAGLGVAGLGRAVRGAQSDWVIGTRTGLAAARALGWPGRRISTRTLPAPVRSALGVAASLPELAARGRGAAVPPGPPRDHVAAVLFTSGSTGPAKGVVYTHAQLEALRDGLARRYGIDSHTGLVAGFAPFALLGPALGARAVTPDMDVTTPGTLTASAVAAAIAAADADMLFLSPAAIANVVATSDRLTPAERGALTDVRTVLSAGAPVPTRLLERFTELTPAASIHTPYGMTEGLLMADVTLDEIRDATTATHRSGTGAETGDGAGDGDGTESGVGVGSGVCVGRAVDGVSVRIAALDADGVPTGDPSDQAGITGEIIVSAPHLMSGYDRLWLTDRIARAGTADAMASSPAADSGVPDAAGERWHRTGDVGHLDADGRLWVEGRLPHVAVTMDGVITPVRPEQRLETLPGVRRAALAAVGPRGIQQLVAVIEPHSPVRRPALAEYEFAEAARSVAGVPLAAVLVVPTVPTDIRHDSKVDRTRLSRWAETVLAGGPMVQP